MVLNSRLGIAAKGLSFMRERDHFPCGNKKRGWNIQLHLLNCPLMKRKIFLLELSCTYFISMTGQVPGPFGCIKMTGTLTLLYSVCW